MMEKQQIGALRTRLIQFAEAPPPFLSVPPTPHTARAAGKIAEVFGDLTPRPPDRFELSDIFRRVENAWKTGNLATLSRRDFRLAPYVFFYPQEELKRWLGLDPRFIEAYTERAPGSQSPRATIALLYEFLRSCKPEFPTYERIRAHLHRRFFKDDPNARLNRWRDRCRAYRFLEGDNHSALVHAWQASGSPSATEFLQEAGLAPSLERSELVRRAVAEVLLGTRYGLQTGETDVGELESVVSWLVSSNRLRFETLRTEIAKSLLGPFVSKTPSEKVAERLRAFFLSYFGDPRTAGIRGWAGVPDELRLVLLRILVGLTLEDFFRLLDRTADKQWAHRKAFWSAYQKKGVISAAWIALGPQAKRLAGAELMMSSGKVSGGGVQQNHSVLLMKISDVTVAEWSHNGKCRFWLPPNPRKPSLFRPAYEGTELNDYAEPDYAVSHHGSDTGHWQERIASWLHSYAGVRIYRSSYMPGGR